MTRFSNSKAAAVGTILGMFLAYAPAVVGEDSAGKPQEVTSTFAVRGMT